MTTFQVTNTVDILGNPSKTIEKIDDDGKVWLVPIDPANSDYQAYLNKDKPKVEHLTEIVPVSE